MSCVVSGLLGEGNLALVSLPLLLSGALLLLPPISM
jgi:hypothetical protein